MSFTNSAFSFFLHFGYENQQREKSESEKQTGNQNNQDFLSKSHLRVNNSIYKLHNVCQTKKKEKKIKKKVKSNSYQVE